MSVRFSKKLRNMGGHRPPLQFVLCLLWLLVPLAAAAQTPTFSRDIAPIFFKNCVTCHHPGQNSPFSLQTYTDARPWAKAIRERVITRYMPPWKPEPGYGDPFQGTRRLEQPEIDAIDRWVSGGAPEGNPADLPRAPHWTHDWRLGVPDVVIRMPDPYELPANGPDVFRNFVLPIPGGGCATFKPSSSSPVRMQCTMPTFASMKHRRRGNAMLRIRCPDMK